MPHYNITVVPKLHQLKFGILGVTLHCHGYANVKWSYNFGESRKTCRAEEQYMNIVVSVIQTGQPRFLACLVSAALPRLSGVSRASSPVWCQLRFLVCLMRFLASQVPAALTGQSGISRASSLGW